MLPIPFAALPRDCPGNRSENRQCAQCKKTQPLLRKSVHKGAVKQENIGQFRPHAPRRRVGRPGRCARTNTAELGAAPLAGGCAGRGAKEVGGISAAVCLPMMRMLLPEDATAWRCFPQAAPQHGRFHKKQRFGARRDLETHVALRNARAVF